jgi:hypothetical protein
MTISSTKIEINQNPVEMHVNIPLTFDDSIFPKEHINRILQLWIAYNNISYWWWALSMFRNKIFILVYGSVQNFFSFVLSFIFNSSRKSTKNLKFVDHFFIICSTTKFDCFFFISSMVPWSMITDKRIFSRNFTVYGRLRWDTARKRPVFRRNPGHRIMVPYTTPHFVPYTVVCMPYSHYKRS